MNIFFKNWLLILMLFSCSFLSAQTGIGTTTPNASAKLDVYSENKGFLPPRVTLTSYTDISTIPNPATGLLIYNTGSNVGLAAGYYYWNGNAWATIATAGGSGSFAASFLRGSRTAAQSAIAVGGIVSFSAVDNTSGSDITLNTSDGKITLRPGNTYRLIAAVPNFSGNRPAFMWYNETSSSYIGSAANGYSPTDGAANAGAFGGLAEVIITPSVSTVLSFRLLSSQNSGAVTVGGLVDFSTTGSYPWFEAQVISGNAPVTGQSVDYIQASLSANQALTTVGNINFNTSSGTGITITSGGFNLIANKTYKLEAAIGGQSGAYAYYGWVDNSNSLLPGGSIGAVMKAGEAYSDAPQDKAVVYFTPTVDTRVFLRVYNLSGTLTAYAPSLSRNFASTWANIQQIGSSAIISPWSVSGTTTYTSNGNIGIGTSSPAASSILDITSDSKGLLPPRVALNAKNQTSSPIASPATGLIVYNTATAGTGGNAVTPGYYYFNGTIWTRMDPEAWSTGVPITFGATTTAPTKGTTTTDYVRFRNIGGKEYEVEYNLIQTVAGTSGSGDYLITLPGSLQFDFTTPGQTAYTGAAGYYAIIERLVNVNGDIYNNGAHNSATLIPYDATKFRIHTNNWGTVGWTFWNSSYYQIGYAPTGFKVAFKFKAQ